MRKVSAPAKPVACSLESTLQAQYGASREQARTAGPNKQPCNVAANVITQYGAVKATGRLSQLPIVGVKHHSQRNCEQPGSWGSLPWPWQEG